MANFYRDCDDLRHRMSRVDWDRIIPLWERNFREAGQDEMAPGSVEEARETHEMILDMVGEFSAEEVAPRAEEVDRQGARLIDGVVHYADATEDQMKKLAELGLLGFTLPRSLGGMNLPLSLYTASVELVSRGDASLMNLYALQACGETINLFASDEIKQKFIPRICTGEWTCCMALTEPNAGSDLPHVSTKATLVDEEKGIWSISGQKCFATNGCGDVLLVLARSEAGSDDARGLSLFVVPKSDAVEVPKIEDKLGIHGSPTCVVNFNDAEGYLVGKRRRGLSSYTLSLLHHARLEVAAQAVGIGQAALVQAMHYSRERAQFGKTIDRFPAVRELLLDAEARVQAARALVYGTAEIVDLCHGLEWCTTEGVFEGDELEEKKRELKRLTRIENLLTPLAKYYATEMANRVAYDMLQVHGGYGFIREYPAERFYRDARITSIYEGTSQIRVGGVVNLFVTGGLRDLLEETAETAAAPEGMDDLLVTLREGYEGAVASADFLAEKGDKDYTRLCAEALARQVIDLYCGFRFLADADASERRAVVARYFIEGARGRMRTDAERIRSGSQLPISGFDAVFEDAYRS
jgi:alkylation response protein AidB-like acyl-CoA dehydrogenase